MRFLGGIDFHNFLSNHEEWHAMVEGFTEGFCWRSSKHQFADQLLEELKGEHHYYSAGRTLGLASAILLATGMLVWIIGAVR